MSEAPLSPRWHQILYRRFFVNSIVSRLGTWILVQLHPRASFDLGLLGVLTTLSALATASIFWRESFGVFFCPCFALLLCLYFFLILFLRFQCSLLEFIAVAIALGNLEGLLLTTPGLYSLGWGWMLCLAGIAAAWILSGAANANAAARILNVEHSGKRLALLFAHWLITATPALLMLGTVLAFGRDTAFLDKSWTEKMSVYIAPQMASWGWVLFGLGVCGMLVQLCLRSKIRQAIRAEVLKPTPLNMS